MIDVRTPGEFETAHIPGSVNLPLDVLREHRDELMAHLDEQAVLVCRSYNDGQGVPGTGPFVYPGEWELFDLENDPQELRNVYDDPAYEEIREQLKVRMWHEQQRLGDRPHPSQPVPPLLSAAQA